MFCNFTFNCLKSNEYNKKPECKKDSFYFVIKLQTACHNVVWGGGTLHPQTAGKNDGNQGHHPGSGLVKKPGEAGHHPYHTHKHQDWYDRQCFKVGWV